ncbi:gamma-glutamyltransferase [Acetobacter sp. TBRC 12305]|uniref:Gamma-glutamyltransferase n=1 Tax=Acetobacter garciniae TaxID=2817435 RepID=A0A939KR39_9PROT|nr:gamma-glutamyltransferase [Acetobacter garciniae]MBO1324536.1 gamma-glutamyltransferase [Acetobacter garciniae]MBX0344225.1 gamma-glutamyltransferase [Acetobacter garciniae]
MSSLSPFGRARTLALGLALAGTLTACGSTHTIQPVTTGYVGSVAADEPSAALVARDILAKGGNAADAATALGFALSVTLPSRASLGSGGACLAWRPGDAAGQAFIFLPKAGTADAKADRPAAVPMLARGLFLMHLGYGSVEFGQLVAPARSLAAQGVSVSGLLATDLNAVKAPLLSDDAVRAVFGNDDDGAALGANDILLQPRLAGALERLRIAGVGDLYNGALGQTFVEGAQAAGGGLSKADLRAALAATQTPLSARADGVDISFLPPPADGGLGMAVAYLAGGRGARAEQVVAAWRARPAAQQGVAQAQAVLEGGAVPTGGALPPLPASTSFVVTDRMGETVSCALSMNNLFGTGRIAGSTGIILAASPTRLPQPLLPVAIAHQGGQFRAAAAASGQNVAADTAAIALHAAISGVRPQVTQGLGRANLVSCPQGLPGAGACFGWTDPRDYAQPQPPVVAPPAPLHPAKRRK